MALKKDERNLKKTDLYKLGERLNLNFGIY